MSIYSFDKHNIELIRSKRKTLSLEIKSDGRIIMRVPWSASTATIERFYRERQSWIDKNLNAILRTKEKAKVSGILEEKEIKELMNRAAKYIPERVKYFAPIVGVDFGRITIRNQKTRWGSCSSKGNLNFNCLLMLTPPEVIDSVVVHELCHRKHMNHSEAFYDEVLKVYPDYYKYHKWLDKEGKVILARMGQ